MDAKASSDKAADALSHAGLPAVTAAAWLQGPPPISRDYARDAAAFTQFWRAGAELRAKLPPKGKRNDAQAAASEMLHRVERQSREEFLGSHVEAVYRGLTADYRNFVRIEQLVFDAAALMPGLTPSREVLARDSEYPLKDQDGLAVDQGIFLAHIFAHQTAGRHLLHAMM
ncbi:MAG: hypothetical protein HY659_13685, partial [Rhizobiales bacterium]|nr:hypothetical protein [Hyphomicrobiales bacterium]